MPYYGGLSPRPARYGGGTPILKRIVDSLNAQLGSAYDTSPASNLYPHTMAGARVLTYAWGLNARLANQWIPAKMTDFLSRWEKVFGIFPLQSDSIITRRARIAAAFARIGQSPTHQAVYDVCVKTLDNVFVGITHTSSADAVTIWPGASNTTPTVDWYSTIAHVLIQVTQPIGMLDSDFYTKAASVLPILDSMLPAWVTFDWYRVIHDGGVTPGFFLDETNLDNEVFDG